MFLAPALTSAQDAGSFSGHWEGEVSVPGTKLGIRFDFQQAGDKASGTIDIPVQGLRGFALGELTVKGKEIAFSLPGVPGDPKFTGTLKDDGSEIAGQLAQSGQQYPFTVRRTEKIPEKGATPARGVPGKGLAGVWQGTLKVQLFQLRLLFKIREEDGKLLGTFDSLDQNSGAIPLSKISLQDSNVVLESDKIAMVFNGKLSEDGSEVDGKWNQAGREMPLVIRRLAEAPDLSRPQDPQKPYPYTEEEVVFRNDGAEIELAGTLTVPQTAGPHPAAILISGSGPQDRDEAIMGHRPFLVLADHLTRQGIAVLRYDDRGVGKSKGSFAKGSVQDFTDDAVAAVKFLQSRPEVDGQRIGLIGHSEGGIVAPRIAATSDDIHFVVMMAGVGVPMEKLLYRQGVDLIRVMGGGEEAIKQQRKTQETIFSILKEQGDPADVEKKMREAFQKFQQDLPEDQREASAFSGEQLEAQIKLVTSPWFRELLLIDPRPNLMKVRCPVLAINGEKDVQVACYENLKAIEAALQEGGNQDVTTVAFPELNHLFQKCDSGALAEYGTIQETINPKVLTTISDWIVKKSK
jgi:pimeloyl-ACP methyl ester carboxylesterase